MPFFGTPLFCKCCLWVESLCSKHTEILQYTPVDCIFRIHCPPDVYAGAFGEMQPQENESSQVLRQIQEPQQQSGIQEGAQGVSVYVTKWMSHGQTEEVLNYL